MPEEGRCWGWAGNPQSGFCVPVYESAGVSLKPDSPQQVSSGPPQALSWALAALKVSPQVQIRAELPARPSPDRA